MNAFPYIQCFVCLDFSFCQQNGTWVIAANLNQVQYNCCKQSGFCGVVTLPVVSAPGTRRHDYKLEALHSLYPIFRYVLLWCELDGRFCEVNLVSTEQWTEAVGSPFLCALNVDMLILVRSFSDHRLRFASRLSRRGSIDVYISGVRTSGGDSTCKWFMGYSSL